VNKLKVLIPVISNTENESDFLDKAIEKAKEVHLILILDPKSKDGLPASAMMQGNSVVQDIVDYLKPKVKEIEEVVEWGGKLNKISHYAKLKEIKKIVLKYEESDVVDELAKGLEDEGFEVQVL